MTTEINDRDREVIFQGIRDKYVKVAVSPQGSFRYPTGLAGLEALEYDRELIASLPVSVAASYCGVGNPFSMEPIKAGESVLDVGCGGGVDTLLAAMMAGPEGRAAGVEIIPEMLARAEENLKETQLENVAFYQASAEELPFPADSFDVVISNGVFNLIPDKARALAEVFRVLKAGGRLMMADQVLTAPSTKDMKARVASWFQ